MAFTWRADGTRHVVRVPIREHSRWRGVITHIRIDPIEEEDVPPPPNRGRLEIGAVRLRGPNAPSTRD